MEFLQLPLISLILFIILFAAFVILVISQAALRREVAENQKQFEQMMDELKALYSGAAGQVNHIARLEEQLYKVSDKQELMDTSDSSHQSYSEAIQIVQRGGTMDDLLLRGLRREEAELLLRLHGQKSLAD